MSSIFSLQIHINVPYEQKIFACNENYKFFSGFLWSEDISMPQSSTYHDSSSLCVRFYFAVFSLLFIAHAHFLQSIELHAECRHTCRTGGGASENKMAHTWTLCFDVGWNSNWRQKKEAYRK